MVKLGWLAGSAFQNIVLVLGLLCGFLMVLFVMVATVLLFVALVVIPICDGGELAVEALCPLLSVLEDQVVEEVINDATAQALAALCHCAGQREGVTGCSTGWQAAPRLMETCQDTDGLVRGGAMLLVGAILMAATLYTMWAVGLCNRQRMLGLRRAPE